MAKDVKTESIPLSRITTEDHAPNEKVTSGRHSPDEQVSREHHALDEKASRKHRAPDEKVNRKRHTEDEKLQESEYTGWPFEDGVNANTIIRTAMWFTIFWGSVLFVTLTIYMVLVRSNLILGSYYSEENPMAWFCFIMIMSGTVCVVFAVWTLVGAIKVKQKQEENKQSSTSQVKQTHRAKVSEYDTLKFENVAVYSAVRESSLSESNIWDKSRRVFRKNNYCISEREVKKKKRQTEKCQKKKLMLYKKYQEECLVQESQPSNTATETN